MFGRFTDAARHVVVFAQDEARRLRHNYIGTEHLLLGLLRLDEGPAVEAMRSLGISLERVRVEVARIIGQGDDLAIGQIPFTPRAKKVLELALKESQALGHSSISPEHILLGLVRENEGVASRILDGSGADAGRVRSALFEQLQVEPGPLYEDRMRGAVGSESFSYEIPRINRLRLLARALVPAAVVLGVGILIGWLIWG